MTTVNKAVVGALTAFGLAAAPVLPTAHGDDPPPAPHRVKYTVTAAQPISAEIYYLDNEPPEFFRWSHNPYEWVPSVKANVGPGQPWVFELMLNNPDQWALVTASSGLSQAAPMFHCELSVDGVVVATKDGPKGVLCSLRHW